MTRVLRHLLTALALLAYAAALPVSCALAVRSARPHWVEVHPEAVRSVGP